jgi:hypothetical protein
MMMFPLLRIVAAILLVLAGSLHAAGPTHVPFPFDWNKVDGSIIDLSRFLDAPAGAKGRLTVEGGHFVNGEGKRVRIWGVNLAIQVCFPKPEVAKTLAADLARWGVNAVRLHHLDTNWGLTLFDAKKDDTQHFHAENLDRLDHLIAELKKHGIYSTITLNVMRVYKAGDEVRDWEILGVGKAANYFNRRLIELQKKYTRDLLSHVNPYTGKSYAEEPALSCLELVNENSFIEAWKHGRLKHGVTKAVDSTWQPITESYADELDDLYYDWLLKHASPEQRAEVTKATGISFESKPTDIEKIRLSPDDFSKASPLRFQTDAAFCAWVEKSYFEEMKQLIRQELHCDALLTLSNDHDHMNAGYSHLQSNDLGDWIDGHTYWQHPHIGKTTSIKNTAMVNSPLESVSNVLARSAIKGKPYTIGEVNHAFPHRYACEGIPLLAAYASFQDWDGLYWFDWEHGRDYDPQKGVSKVGWFDISIDPMKLAQMATCALIWHRGDVAPAKQTHLRSYTSEQARETLRSSTDHRPFYDAAFDLKTPLLHGVRLSFDKESKTSKAPGKEAAPRISDIPREALTTDTGEICWSHAAELRGMVKIDTPYTCGLIGHVQHHWYQPEATTRHLAADVKTEHGCVLLTSLDHEPLATSSRLLLTATCRSANTGQTWQDDLQTLASWGTGPMTIAPYTGNIHIKALKKVKSLKATPLTAEGCRAGEPVEVWKNGDHWELWLGKVPTTWWELQVERVTKK